MKAQIYKIKNDKDATNIQILRIILNIILRTILCLYIWVFEMSYFQKKIHKLLKLSQEEEK